MEQTVSIPTHERRSAAQAWLTVFVITVLSGFLGEAYGAVFYESSDADYYQGFRTGASIGFISAVIEVFYIRSVRRSWIRRVAFLPGLLVRILVLTLIIRVCLVGNALLTDFLLGQEIGVEGSMAEEMRDTLFSMALVVLFVTLSQLGSVIGFRRFSNLVVGRYFRPVSEERIFLFVDLIDSSKLAREMGDLRFHNFLSEFFFQADASIVATGGEIVSYVGDAVIVTWPLRDDPKRNADCLKALRLIDERMKQEAPSFEAEYGHRARFRAALHGGPVVVGECGDSRRQVTFLGDVVNMTARIEQVSKDLGQNFLASAEIVERIEPLADTQFERIGKFDLKGADEKMELYAIRLTANA
ncbi:adenylate/guanylate cyclase domain-containing protein [Pseudahrensia aquimaris]|uniref:Adenylate/guanylate cyclase domain-containing protein n=1 Tax=Pseudahrensia aquimaris TaxID=744461 RepID=A0ABW3FJB0_9HYPH